MRYILTLLIAALASIPSAAGAEADAPVQVLLVSGQNNHNWRATTPKIKSILEDSGRFQVEVTEQPEKLDDEALKAFDVIVSNWNCWGKENEDRNKWSDATKRAYLDFVRAGGGHVVVHAGSSSFPSWKEYHELTLATWKLGQTGHGPRHEFPVRIDKADHPITQGLTDFTIFDELWNRPGIQEGVTLLASSFSSKEHGGTGEHEPAAMVKSFGKGRSYTLMLGHGVEEMNNPGFVALLVRGTEWAATGRVTVTRSNKSTLPSVN